MNEKILKAFENKSFVEKTMCLETKDEVKNAFDEEGVKVTDQELDELAVIISEITEAVKKIPETELANIAGGVGIPLQQQFENLGDYLGASKSIPNPEYQQGNAIMNWIKWRPKTITLQSESQAGDFIHEHAAGLALGTIAVGVVAAGIAGIKVFPWVKKKIKDMKTDISSAFAYS